jgi:two-component system CheB/CheR fusion protein
MASTFLELRGHNIVTVNDGLQPFELANLHHPGIVVLDLGMPGMNGLEVVRGIRSQSWGKDVFLIAATGWGSEQDHKLTQTAGFNLPLTKPLAMDHLERALVTAQNRLGIDADVNT